MKKLFKLIGLIGAIVILAVSMAMPGTYAKQEYTKKEKKSCKYCHSSAKPSKDDLTEAGKYYRDHDHSLKGYVEKENKKQ
jgi:hypothetical protein